MAVEHTVQVAQASVTDSVAIDDMSPDEQRLPAGNALGIRFAYKFYEKSREQDQWNFKLAVKLAGGEDLVDEQTHKDHAMISDDVMSNVGVDLSFPESGTYQVDYEVSAILSRRQDKNDEFTEVANESITGTFSVVAE